MDQNSIRQLYEMAQGVPQNMMDTVGQAGANIGQGFNDAGRQMQRIGQGRQAATQDPLRDPGFQQAVRQAYNAGDADKVNALFYGALSAGAAFGAGGAAVAGALPLAGGLGAYSVLSGTVAGIEGDEAEDEYSRGAVRAGHLRNVQDNRQMHGQSLPQSPMQNAALMQALRGR